MLFANPKTGMLKEEEIKDCLNELTGGHIKEVSLIYDLNDFIKLQKERDKLWNKIEKLKKKISALEESDEKTKIRLKAKLSENVTKMFMKVTELSKFRDDFAANPEKHFNSRRLFVTFENFKYAKDFKDIYNQEYRVNPFSLPMKLLKKENDESQESTEDEQELQAQAKKDGPERDYSKSKGRMERDEAKYVDVEKKLIYRGSVSKGGLDPEMIKKLAEKQKMMANTESDEDTDDDSEDSKLGTKNLKKRFLSERPSDHPKRVDRERRRGKHSNLTKFYMRENEATEGYKRRRMREIFGGSLVVARSIEPKYINWDFDTDVSLGKLESICYFVLILVFMPCVCFYLNLKFLDLDISLKIDEEPGAYTGMMKTGWLISILIWDQLAMTLTTMVFSKSRFLVASSLYKYTYSFFCLYGVLSGILMPNFAMVKAFQKRFHGMEPEAARELAVYLVDGLYMNFKMLIFSAVNFKIFQPFLVHKVGKFLFSLPSRIFKAKKKAKPAKTKTKKFDLFKEITNLKLETQKLVEKQESENNALIFGLSFFTNCWFNVCFYGLLTPSVFFYILPAYASLVLFDAARFRLKDKQELERKHKELKQKQTAAGLKNEASQHQVQEVPWTIFVNFLYMLLVGCFPLTLLGYFGLAKKFNKLMIVQPILLKSSGRPSFFFHMYDTFFHTLERFSKFVFNDNAITVFETFLHNVRDIFKTTLKTLASDRLLLGALVCYVLILLLISVFFRIERYINRVQSRIWKNTKHLAVEFTGESFRNANPAYQLKR